MKNQSEARSALVTLSNQLSVYVEAGMYDTINEAVIAFYSDEVHTTFKKFREWKAEGKKIKKGSKSFPVWARPLAALKAEANEGKPEPQEEEDNYRYFPICHLFSNAQVE